MALAEVRLLRVCARMGVHPRAWWPGAGRHRHFKGARRGPPSRSNTCTCEVICITRADTVQAGPQLVCSRCIVEFSGQALQLQACCGSQLEGGWVGRTWSGLALVVGVVG